MISGFLAVLLAEFVGELREKIQGGTSKKNMHFDHAEFTSAVGMKAEKKQGEEEEKKEKKEEVTNHEEDDQ